MAGYSRPAVARIFGVPALGGLLFGWDIGATSYVLTQLQSAEYSGVSWSGAVARSSFLQGLITSGGVAGALIGAAIVFRVADAIGRRRELILAALLYIAGAVLEVASGSFGTSEASGLALLLLGRLVYGAACGFAMRVPGVRRNRLHAIAETSRRHRSPTHTGTARPRTSPRCRPRPYEGRSSA